MVAVGAVNIDCDNYVVGGLHSFAVRRCLTRQALCKNKQITLVLFAFQDIIDPAGGSSFVRLRVD